MYNHKQPGPGNDLPPVVHAELTPDDIGDGRIIVIGDVHGCLSELKALLEKCAADCYIPPLCCPVTIVLKLVLGVCAYEVASGPVIRWLGGANSALGFKLCLCLMQLEARGRVAGWVGFMRLGGLTRRGSSILRL